MIFSNKLGPSSRLVTSCVNESSVTIKRSGGGVFTSDLYLRSREVARAGNEGSISNSMEVVDCAKSSSCKMCRGRWTRFLIASVSDQSTPPIIEEQSSNAHSSFSTAACLWVSVRLCWDPSRKSVCGGNCCGLLLATASTSLLTSMLVVLSSLASL